MRIRLILAAGAAAGLFASCKPSEILNVPPPATQFGNGTPQNAQQAVAAYDGAKVTFFQNLEGAGVVSLLVPISLLTDEFRASGNFVYTDARYTSAKEFSQAEIQDQALQGLYNARSSFLLAENALQRYEPDSGQWQAGEAFALVGYIELFMAEDFCAGVTLSYVPVGGGVIYGTPLTTDSLLGVAEVHFDSALAHAHGNSTVTALASVGLGRARLNRAKYSSAAGAVAAVPTNFVYNGVLTPDLSGAGAVGVPNIYTNFTAPSNCAAMTVADHEGANGLNFLSANDPRLVLDTTVAESCDGANYRIADSLFYYPTKFGIPPTGFIPLATGVEARLIEAEAALASNAPLTWAADLNALRMAAPNTYLALPNPIPSLTTDSTTGAAAATQVDVMFRERAFWLFGLGTRLGDLRRLIRQYHRAQGTVFPTGSYPYPDAALQGSGVVNYGTDVSLTLPTPQGSVTVTNPNYRGCLNSAGTA